MREGHKEWLTTMEEYKYGPSSLGLGALGSEHADLAPTEVIVLYPPYWKGCRGTWHVRRVADRRVPRELMYLGEMDKVFVVKRGILGVKSRNDGGVQGIWHCYCGAELRGNWSIF